jgi:acyl-homoserine-lactone acylase
LDASALLLAPARRRFRESVDVLRSPLLRPVVMRTLASLLKHMTPMGATLAVALAAGLEAQAIPRSAASHAEILTTAYGVPHVRAADLAGAGLGLGYAFAKAELCTVADRWVTVRAQRSRYFGVDGPRDGRQPVSNVESDLYWQRILDLDLVGQELRQPPPLGPTPQVRELVGGYVAGYNRYLAEAGVDGIPDRRCRGQEWVRPITEKDVYLRALHWNLYISSRWIGPIVAAARPGDPVPPGRSPPADDDAAASFGLTMSNMIALGRDATDNGRGMLFANPHWRWHEPERWFEAHLTVPGAMDVYGAVLEGVPVFIFGFNPDVAWTHTASVPRRETVYELRLAPGSPTSYEYEGQTRAMTPLTATVEVREANGRIGTRSHTFWETHFGPVLANDTYTWTERTAYAIRHANANFRWLNQQLGMMLAGSVEELDRVGRTYLGLGWINTAAADAAGNTVYADRSAVPHVTDAMIERCVSSELGKRVFGQQQLPVLDGWRRDCEWGTDPDAPLPGIFGPAHLPQLSRRDYVTNSNDSHWANNPREPLEGFARIIGDERTPRSLRTRIGLQKIEARLRGTDGQRGTWFTLDQLEAITMNNRVLSGEIWRDELVGLCRSLPESGIPAACDALASWDLTDDLDSPGAVLWRRFVERLVVPGTPTDELFTVPFDPDHPVDTPRGLASANPRVKAALLVAISDLRDGGMSLSATLRDHQIEERAGLRIPIHGGSPLTGQYNMIITESGWVPGKGWSTVVHGSSYIMWMQFTDRGPVGRSVMASSQSDNPESPHHADQTVLFSRKGTKPILFDEAAIRADPNLTVIRVCATPAGTACN